MGSPNMSYYFVIFQFEPLSFLQEQSRTPRRGQTSLSIVMPTEASQAHQYSTAEPNSRPSISEEQVWNHVQSFLFRVGNLADHVNTRDLTARLNELPLPLTDVRTIVPILAKSLYPAVQSVQELHRHPAPDAHLVDNENHENDDFWFKSKKSELEKALRNLAGIPTPSLGENDHLPAPPQFWEQNLSGTSPDFRRLFITVLEQAHLPTYFIDYIDFEDFAPRVREAPDSQSRMTVIDEAVGKAMENHSKFRILQDKLRAKLERLGNDIMEDLGPRPMQPSPYVMEVNTIW